MEVNKWKMEKIARDVKVVPAHVVQTIRVVVEDINSIAERRIIKC